MLTKQILNYKTYKILNTKLTKLQNNYKTFKSHHPSFSTHFPTRVLCICWEKILSWERYLQESQQNLNIARRRKILFLI